jgi:hypothetical protein
LIPDSSFPGLKVNNSKKNSEEKKSKKKKTSREKKKKRKLGLDPAKISDSDRCNTF